MSFLRRLEEVERIPLGYGAHTRRADGLCVMEAAAYLAGLPHTDKPSCVCPVISAFLQVWNDGLPDDATRDRLLKPLLTRILDTRSTPEVEEQRGYLALDWLVRVCTPAFLRLHPELREHADVLSRLAPLRGIADARAASRAYVAAWDAARESPWGVNAAEYAVVCAGGFAARAAWGVVKDPEWDVTFNAARLVARLAAQAVAGALAPIIAMLQLSALDLVEQIIKVEA